MKITFCGAVGCVTGSNYLIETSKCRFLVDCGMFQGNKTLKENNYRDFSYNPSSIDFVLITHAHIDHTGLLPKLVKHGFNGKIYATEPTVDLLRFMLPDSAHIQEVETAQKNRRNERKGLMKISPIYTEDDALNTLKLLSAVKRYETFEPAEGCRVKLYNAGHVFGSAFIEIELTDEGKTKKLIFSGDLGDDDKPIINNPDRFAEADYLLIESTYGSRNRDIISKEARLEGLAKVFDEAEKRGGKLIIPAFALERTQDLMHDILILKEKKRIGGIRVVVDSPLASEITKVFVKYPEMYDEDAKNVKERMGHLFDHSDFSFTQTVEESKALNEQNHLVILSAGGMCDAGRIKHHLKHNLYNRANTVLFVGFQAEGTLGRLLIDGAKKVRIHGEEIHVGAHIEQISGYSGHADQRGLLKWLSAAKEIRQNVFVVHGEPAAANELANLINDRFGFNAIVPSMGQSFDLLKQQQTAQKAAITPEEEKPLPAAHLGSDSYNMYAKLMLKLADFMRSTTSENERLKTISKLLTQL